MVGFLRDIARQFIQITQGKTIERWLTDVGTTRRRSVNSWSAKLWLRINSRSRGFSSPGSFSSDRIRFRSLGAVPDSVNRQSNSAEAGECSGAAFSGGEAFDHTLPAFRAERNFFWTGRLTEGRGVLSPDGPVVRAGYSDIPGQQFLDAVDWMVGDALGHLTRRASRHGSTASG